MKSPKLQNTLKKEKARIEKLTEDELNERQKEVAVATAADIKSVLRKHKQNECDGDDGGLLKAKVFNLYGLGEPPRKSWSKTGVMYLLDERGYVYEASEVATKKDAVRTLLKEMAKDAGSNGAEDEDDSDGVAQALFTTPQSKNKRRLELLRELHDIDKTTSSAMKKTKTSNEHGSSDNGNGMWAGNMSVD